MCLESLAPPRVNPAPNRHRSRQRNHPRNRRNRLLSQQCNRHFSPTHSQRLSLASSRRHSPVVNLVIAPPASRLCNPHSNPQSNHHRSPVANRQHNHPCNPAHCHRNSRRGNRRRSLLSNLAHNQHDNRPVNRVADRRDSPLTNLAHSRTYSLLLCQVDSLLLHRQDNPVANHLSSLRRNQPRSHRECLRRNHRLSRVGCRLYSLQCNQPDSPLVNLRIILQCNQAANQACSLYHIRHRSHPFSQRVNLPGNPRVSPRVLPR